jgi:DNA adenine methylase
MIEDHILESCSKRLRSNTSITCQDFEVALEQCSEGDFAYLDPPYLAGHRTNGFVDYNARIFSTEDQMRLADVFHELNRRGAYIILTNADHDSIRHQYRDFKMNQITRFSSMAGKNNFRGPSTELMIMSDRIAEEYIRQ